MGQPFFQMNSRDSKNRHMPLSTEHAPASRTVQTSLPTIAVHAASDKIFAATDTGTVFFWLTDW